MNDAAFDASSLEVRLWETVAITRCTMRKTMINPRQYERYSADGFFHSAIQSVRAKTIKMNSMIQTRESGMIGVN